MPSGDSSPCTLSTRLLPGVILLQGDESPDAINRVPTKKGVSVLLRRVCLLRRIIQSLQCEMRLNGL